MKTFEKAMRKHLQEVEAQEKAIKEIRKCREKSLEAMSIGLANAKKEIEAKDREIAELKIPDSIKTCEAIWNLETEPETTGQQLSSEIERKETIENILGAAHVKNSYYERELLRAEGMLKSEQARSRRLVEIMQRETSLHRRLFEILSISSFYGNNKLKATWNNLQYLENQKEEELGD